MLCTTSVPVQLLSHLVSLILHVCTVVAPSISITQEHPQLSAIPNPNNKLRQQLQLLCYPDAVAGAALWCQGAGLGLSTARTAAGEHTAPCPAAKALACDLNSTKS